MKIVNDLNRLEEEILDYVYENKIHKVEDVRRHFKNKYKDKYLLDLVETNLESNITVIIYIADENSEEYIDVMKLYGKEYMNKLKNDTQFKILSK